MMRKSSGLLVAAALVALLSGCSEEQKQDEAKPAAKPKQVFKQVSTAAPPKPVDFGGIRDPFQALVKDEPKLKAAGEGAPGIPIERYESGDYRYLGTVVTDGPSYALVGDPEGKSHVVRKGARVGRGGGVVTRIKLDSIEISESTAMPNGKRLTRTIRLEAPRKW